MATMAIASVVFRSVLALLNHGTSTPACLPSFLGVGKFLPLLDADIAAHRPWRQVAEGSLAFKDLHFFVGQAVIVLGCVVMVVVTVVVSNFFVSLNPAYRAEARKYSNPVGDEDEQEDAHHQREEHAGTFPSGNSLS